MTIRHYVDFAPATTLAAPINSTTNTVLLITLLGYPTAFPYTAVLDNGTGTQELVLVTAASGTVATITRNFDGTGASGHLAGGTFEHVSAAIDFTEANVHTSATSGVHGVVGAVVGTTDTQAISGKTISGSTMASLVGVPAVLTSTDIDASHVISVKNVATTETAFVTGAGATTVASLTSTGAVALSGAVTLTGVTIGGHLTGEILMRASTNVPTGYLACDGSAVSRTTFARLFTEIGTNYGVGNGSTTFNVPLINDSGAFLIGSTVPGTVGGSATHSHTAGTLAALSHNHGLTTAYAEIFLATTPQAVNARFTGASYTATNQLTGGVAGTALATAQTSATALGGTTDNAAPTIVGTSATTSSLPPFIGVFALIKT